MESELCILKEYGISGGDSDSNILEVVDFDKSDEFQRRDLIALFWEFWLKVNREDQSLPVHYNIMGIEYEIPEIEATLYGCLHQGGKVKVAYKGETMVGFMLYHMAFDCVAIIRHMYCLVDKLAKPLVDSTDALKVIFQTRKENPPTRLLEITKPFRSKIKEDDKLITWEMNWER